MPDASLGNAAGVLTADEKRVEKSPMERVASALHDMCQPLMTLQCRLEIGRMVATAEGNEEAVRESLVECTRLLHAVDVLRHEVVRGLEAEKAS